LEHRVINNEQHLPQRLAKGDSTAMCKIFYMYYPKLCLYADSLVQNKEEAEDIAQEALAQLWHHRLKFAGLNEENISAYLFTTVKHDCYDYHKHEQVKRAKKQDIIDLIPESNDSVESAFIYLEVLSKIYAEIRNLPPHLSEIVRMSFIEGLTTEQISEHLRITPNNVRVQKARALEKLRNALLKQNLLSPALVYLVFSEIFYK
jgi:RNA polymerase sigma-70 factor (ECF subfamily)